MVQLDPGFFLMKFLGCRAEFRVFGCHDGSNDARPMSPSGNCLYDYFDLWSWNGALDRIHVALYAQCRQAASGEPHRRESAGKGACIDPAGYAGPVDACDRPDDGGAG